MTDGRLRPFGWGLAIAFTVLLTIVVLHARSPDASSTANPSWVTPALSGVEPGRATLHHTRSRLRARRRRRPPHWACPAYRRRCHRPDNGPSGHQNGDERFHTASIVKVDILACLLWQDQRAGKQMTTAQMSQAAKMIEISDNVATDALFALIGKQSGLAEANRAFGLTQTAPGTTVHPWGQTLTTARDQLRVLELVSDPGGPLTAANKAYILGLMKSVVSNQRRGISAAVEHAATATAAVAAIRAG